MTYFLCVHKRKYGNYYSYKHNFRENGKVKSKYVYLGSEDRALTILADFNSKKPLNERLLSFSGEKILSEVLKLIDFKSVVNKMVRYDTKLDAGHFTEMIVVERALNGFSKWGLAEISHGKSIFSLDAGIPSEKFTDANIYHYMDYISPNVDSIQKSLVKNLLRIDGMEPNELIIDGTSVYCFGDDKMKEEAGDDDGNEAEDEDEKEDKYADLKRINGYSRDKRPDLAQVNLMLGVNEYSIPMLFETFPGNAPDVYMFKEILEKCRRDYPFLLAKVRSKYIVFDKGNNNPDNFKELDTLCREWDLYFVASVRPSMTAVRKQLSSLTIKNVPVIYKQDKTKLRGKTTTLSLYGDARTVLVYLNEEIMKKKQEAFQEKLKCVQEKIREQNEQDRPVDEKLVIIERLLRKNKLLTCFKRDVEKDVVKCVLIKKKVDVKMNTLGKFAIITNDSSLDAADIMRIYKTTGVVERDFHLLKSELSVRPIFHRKPERIRVHFALVLWGMMGLTLLRHLLANQSMKYTFERLRAKIQEGYVSIGDHVYPGYKSFRIRKALNIDQELTNIFQVLKVRHDYFEIELVPTDVEK